MVYAFKPPYEQVRIYFLQKGMPETEAADFYQFYEMNKWETKNGVAIIKWKDFAYRWIACVVQNQPSLFNRYIH